MGSNKVGSLRATASAQSNKNNALRAIIFAQSGNVGRSARGFLRAERQN